MSNEKQKNSDYDLEERTTVFAERIVSFVDKLKKDSVPERVVDRIVGSGTAIGV